MTTKNPNRILLGAITALGLSGLALPSAYGVAYTLAPNDGSTAQDWGTSATWGVVSGSPGAAVSDSATVSGSFGGVSQTVNISAVLSNGLGALTLGDTSGNGTTTIKSTGSNSLFLASSANVTSTGAVGAVNIISAPVSYAGGLNFLAGNSSLSITGKLAPSVAGNRTVDNSSGNTITFGDVDLSVGSANSTITFRNGTTAGNKMVFSGTIADGVALGNSTIVGSTVFGSRAATGVIQIDGTNTYTGATTLGVQGLRSVYQINSNQPFGPASGGALTLGGPSNAVNVLEALNADRTITKGTINIQRNVGAQGSNSLSLAANTIIANSSQTHTNDIAAGDTLSLGVAGGSYFLNNNATDKNRVTTFAGSGTTVVISNIADNSGVIAADSKNVLAMSGNGTLVLTGTNVHQGGTRITSTGTIQIGNGSTTGSIEPGNSLTPVVTGTAAGTLAFNRSGDAALSVVANGPLNLVQKGAGSLTLINSQFHTGTNTVGDGTTATKLVVSGGLVAGASTTTNATIVAVAGAPGIQVTLGGSDTVSSLGLKVGQPVYVGGTASANSYIHSISGTNGFVVFGTTILTATPSMLNFGSGSALGTSASVTTVNNLGTLAGSGVIAGQVNALAGSILSPGVNDGDVATLSTGALNISNATLDFDLAATAAGPSDLINASGAVNFSGLTFRFDAVTAGVLDGASSYNLVSGTSFVGDVGLIATTFGSGLQGLYTPTYSVVGNNLTVAFSAIPEPSGVAALAGMAALGGCFVRRRRRA